MLTLSSTTAPSQLLANRPSGTPPGIREAEAAATDLARNETHAANEGFAKELAEVRARERSEGFGSQGREVEPRDTGTRDVEATDADGQPGDESGGEAGSESPASDEPATTERSAPATPAHGEARQVDLVELRAKSAGASAQAVGAQVGAQAAGLTAGANTLLAPGAGTMAKAVAPAPEGAPANVAAPAAAQHVARDTAAAVAVPKAAAPTPVARLAVEHRDSIFQQVAMSLDGQGASSVEMLLEPPELGLLALTLDLDGSQVRLTVGAERPEVAEQIKAHMMELRAALQAQGLAVTHFEVRDGAGDRGGSGAHAGSRRRGGAAPVEIERRTERVRILEGSALDILV